MIEAEFDQELYAQIGFILEMLQFTEGAIMTAMHLALHEQGLSSINEYESLEGILKKMTLGRLLKKLRADVKLDSDFEDFAESYLADRNEFIHRSFKLHDVDTPEGRQSMLNLIYRLFKGSERLTEIFVAVLVDWSGQAGFTVLNSLASADPEAANYISTLKNESVPIARGVFQGYKEKK